MKSKYIKEAEYDTDDCIMEIQYSGIEPTEYIPNKYKNSKGFPNKGDVRVVGIWRKKKELTTAQALEKLPDMVSMFAMYKSNEDAFLKMNDAQCIGEIPIPKITIEDEPRKVLPTPMRILTYSERKLVANAWYACMIAIGGVPKSEDLYWRMRKEFFRDHSIAGSIPQDMMYVDKQYAHIREEYQNLVHDEFLKTVKDARSN